ncbi:hypothetical protein CONPUDRAFT_151503 [Coniophora puteana RWD-64-598 SS2]|uniref:Uncharacterized protein n=1 Tax=Coniophora puteana (strain RWD-64-598) TaxID=741705 RepID=A0A5M3N0Q2_CONPW|nr:uncharacterized protein CONPUDRAFT_151503 [Coniophora puteana RWD-64-598 SS2]EIW84485.1 hypothetical protein CONPUDRAFT_151503 [Coniophora puteana RWD-64-598 SS2]
MSRTPYPRSPAPSLASLSETSDVAESLPLSTGVVPSSSPASPPPSVAPAAPLSSHTCPDAVTSSPFPANPPSPPNPYHAYAFLSKKKGYQVDCSCGHFNIHMQGNGTANEVLTACVGQCCLNLVSETVADLITKAEWKLDFQEMVHASICTEVLNLPNNDEFTRFFHRCASMELHRHFQLARARFAAAGSASGAASHMEAGADTTADDTGDAADDSAYARLNCVGEIPSAFLHLPTQSSVTSARGTRTIEYTHARSVNEDRFPFGVIPLDGIINRNLKPTFGSLVAGLPTRTVYLTPSVEVTYYDAPANAEPPYYWVPYGYAIGVFANPHLYYTVWGSGRGSEGHEVFSLDEAHAALENALLEGRFGVVR